MEKDAKIRELEKRLENVSRKNLAAFFLDLATRDSRFSDRLESLLRSHDSNSLNTFLLSRMEAFYNLAELPSYRDLFSLARDLRTFLSDLEIFLAHEDPMAALDLLDRFFTLDYLFAEFEEDATPLQRVFSEASILWLRIAECLNKNEDVLERILGHFLNDRSNAKGDILAKADIVLSGDELFLFSERLLEELDHQESEAESDWLRYRVALGLRYLSTLLRTPDLLVKSILLLHPEPGPRQIREIVQAHIDFEGPDAALPWLTGDWGEMEMERLKLLDLVYGAMDDQEMLFEIRREAYAAEPSAESLHALLEVCGKDEREAWLAEVPESARHAGSLYSALNLLFAARFFHEAEELLFERNEDLLHYDHTALGRLLEKFEKEELVRGQILCLRVLVSGILLDGKVRAFEKALDYCETLMRLDKEGNFSETPFSHEIFLSDLRKKHGNRTAFWQKLDARTGANLPIEKNPGKTSEGAGAKDSATNVSRETSGSKEKKKVSRGTSGGVFG